MADIRLIAGLGNPGKSYEKTRHNIGFMVVNELAKAHQVIWKEWKGIAEVAVIRGSDPLLLLKPQTYMNNSGTVVQRVMHFRSIDIAQLLVVVDDFSIPLGKVRLRRAGSAGGHNGLSSCIQYLGSSEFARLRIGIGPVPPAYDDSADFVLGKFTKEERAEVPSVIDKASSIIMQVLQHGITDAISRVGTL